MPTYSYTCGNCSCDFELFLYIKDYTEHPKCIHCDSNNTHREYAKDVITQSASVRKSDNELKTIGDLAKRNSERMSDDEKVHLHQKHNSYREDGPQKELPRGMSRIKKQPKPVWPGSKGKNKRKPKI
jgi:putative FmdB family regulatory protein